MLLALPMMLGLASFTENDNPVDDPVKTNLPH